MPGFQVHIVMSLIMYIHTYNRYSDQDTEYFNHCRKLYCAPLGAFDKYSDLIRLR